MRLHRLGALAPFTLITVLTLLWGLGGGPAVVAEEGTPAQNGRFFTEAGGGTGGFLITDSDGIQFWSAYQRLGGSALLGYPASRRFELNGLIYQVTQAGALQRGPEGSITLANTFELLQGAGKDPWLDQTKGIPPATVNDGSTDYDDAVRIRLSWLTQPEIAERYFSNPNPSGIDDWAVDDSVQLYGLPMGRPEQRGPFIAQRFQRIAFQLWTDQVPEGPPAGTVSTVLGGDLLKEAGIVPGDAQIPATLADAADQIVRLPTATRTATPPPTPTAAPQLSVVSRNVKQSGSNVTILGEFRNDSSVRASYVVKAVLLDASGNPVASGTDQSSGFSPPLGTEPGQILPYSITIIKAPPFTTVAVTAVGKEYSKRWMALLAPMTSSLNVSTPPPPTPYPSSRPLPTATPTNGRAYYSTLAASGSVTNHTSNPLKVSAVVWFVDSSGRVVDMHRFVSVQPSPLYPNITATFDERTNRVDAIGAKVFVWGYQSDQ